MPTMNGTSVTRLGDLVLLIDSKNKPFIFRLQPGLELQTHRGVIRHDDLAGAAWGARVLRHFGGDFLSPQSAPSRNLAPLAAEVEIVFPKELGYILLRL